MERVFEYADDYDVATDEMHRRVAAPCAVPAVVRHIALWPNRAIRTWTNIKKQDEYRQEWLHKVADRLSSLETVITGDPKSDCFSKTALSVDKSAYLIAHGASFSWRIKVDVHFEFIALTIILSFGRENTKYRPAEEFIDWPIALSDVTPENLLDAMQTLQQSATEDNSADNVDQKTWEERKIAELQPYVDILYQTIWERLSEAAWPQDASFQLFPGKLFADFRCHVYSADSSSTPQSTKNRKFATHAIGRYQTMFKAINANADHREFVGCAMLNWRVVYVSTLGSRLTSDKRAGDPKELVRYTLCCTADPDRHQIGRLIERINTLGVARIAALKGVRRIRRVARQLQAMELELDAITTDSVVGRPDTQSIEDATNAQSDMNRSHPIENFFYRLNNLGSEDLQSVTEPERMSDGLDGGVKHRISRSRYYKHIIDTRLDDLRIERIESWQPYDEFLKRRLFPTMQFIADVGNRIEILNNQANSFLSLLEVHETRKQMILANDWRRQQERSNTIGFWSNILILILTIVLTGFGVMAIQGYKIPGLPTASPISTSENETENNQH